jgi:D-alanyl-lipoteichoic acid acyltransferase DltB (MBOAT superfamily)
LGLSKKIFLADESQIYVDNFFNKVQWGYSPGFITSWIHSSLFLFQLYFDFSSYSDMAIGLGLMCNIKLPINFDSPLKSKSVIEFWRKWHITLTKIIYEFIFIPSRLSHWAFVIWESCNNNMTKIVFSIIKIC